MIQLVEQILSFIASKDKTHWFSCPYRALPSPTALSPKMGISAAPQECLVSWAYGSFCRHCCGKFVQAAYGKLGRSSAAIVTTEQELKFIQQTLNAMCEHIYAEC